jgi:hypothetical protein
VASRTPHRHTLSRLWKEVVIIVLLGGMTLLRESCERSVRDGEVCLSATEWRPSSFDPSRTIITTSFHRREKVYNTEISPLFDYNPGWTTRDRYETARCVCQPLNGDQAASTLISAIFCVTALVWSGQDSRHCECLLSDPHHALIKSIHTCSAKAS